MKRENPPDVPENQHGPREDSEQEGSTDSGTKKGLGRRRFLAAGISAAAAIAAIPSLTQSQQRRRTQRRVGRQRAAPRALFASPFPQPFPLDSNGGVLNAPLTVSLVGTPGAQYRVYNAALPGPTLNIKAGDTMKITLSNQLPANPPPPNPSQGGSLDYCKQPNAMSNPHCFNSTNLHTHGLHVSPGSVYQNGVAVCASDDVLITIPPGAKQEYGIEVPPFHAPGTHWYHAHLHGATALQLVNGLCGAIIIEEPDDMKIMQAAHADYVWIIQESLPKGQDQTIYTSSGAQSSTFVVNGVSQPQLTMSKNEVQRWRLINATGTPRGLGQLVLVNSAGVNQPMNQIAQDGISFYGKKPVPVTELNLGAGNRADVLVQLSQPGNYQLIRNDYPWGGGGAGPQVLANITVLTTAVDMTMPDTIPGTPPPYLQPITSFTPNAHAAIFGAIKASQWASKCTTPKPAAHPAGILPSLDVINCKEYMPPPTPDAPANSAYDQFIVKLNTAEQWVLSNAGGSAHPFHLHVNPFQVEGMLIDPNGPNDPTNWMFVDTVPLIPPGSSNPPLWAQGGQIKIRTRYMTYYGRYVTHCHILVHEDLGMMANIYVQDDGTGIGPCKKI